MFETFVASSGWPLEKCLDVFQSRMIAHVLTIALSIAIGGSMAWMDRNLGSRLWLRTDQYSHRAQNVIGMVLSSDFAVNLRRGVLGGRVGSLIVQNFVK
jgi:hypothetical protein